MPLHSIAILIMFVALCCLWDMRTRRIPNALSGSALLIALALNTASFAGAGFASSIAGAALMVAVLFAPFALGGIGGGDVKMMAAVGAFLGPRVALASLITGMMLGGVVMAIHLVRAGRLADTIASMTSRVVAATVTRSASPLRMSVQDAGTIALPYSIPLALGTALVVAATALR